MGEAQAGRARAKTPAAVAVKNSRLLHGITSRLTPELSRADERPRRWDNLSASAEAAKRTRLERIVRSQLDMLKPAETLLKPHAPGCILTPCAHLRIAASTRLLPEDFSNDASVTFPSESCLRSTVPSTLRMRVLSPASMIGVTEGRKTTGVNFPGTGTVGQFVVAVGSAAIGLSERTSRSSSV